MILRQIKRIVKTAETKHYLKAFVSPVRTLQAFKYHYRRVSEMEFVEFLSKKYSCTKQEVEAAYRDYEDNVALWKEVKNKLKVYPSSYGLQMTKESPALYLIIRLIKPSCIIETGVSSGASSTYILSALHDNKNGRLYSIDLPPENLPLEKTNGWIVPAYLRDRWDLLVGDSKNILRPLLRRVGEIDCFLHDSLHTYEHMMWEFSTAWSKLRLGGLFLSHDVGANDAFFDFMKEKKIAFKDYRVLHVLGGFQKVQ